MWFTTNVLFSYIFIWYNIIYFFDIVLTTACFVNLFWISMVWILIPQCKKINRLFLVQKTSEKLSWHPKMSHPKRKCRFFKHQVFKWTPNVSFSPLSWDVHGTHFQWTSCHQDLRGWKSACRENRWSCLSSMVAPLSDRWWIVNAELWVTGTAPNQPHRKKMGETAGSRWKSGHDE